MSYRFAVTVSDVYVSFIDNSVTDAAHLSVVRYCNILHYNECVNMILATNDFGSRHIGDKDRIIRQHAFYYLECLGGWCISDTPFEDTGMADYGEVWW